MYQVPNLLQEVQNALQPEVNVHTCRTMLVAAWHHNAKELEEFCWRFIKPSHASKSVQISWTFSRCMPAEGKASGNLNLKADENLRLVLTHHPQQSLVLMYVF